MIDAHLKFVIPVFLSEKNQYHILSTDQYQTVLPSIQIISFMDLPETYNHILSLYIKSDTTNRIPVKITDLEITDVINIYVLLFINFDAEINNAYLRPINLDNDKYPINTYQALSLLVR